MLICGVVAVASLLNILQKYASLEALLRLASGQFLSVNLINRTHVVSPARKGGVKAMQQLAARVIICHSRGFNRESSVFYLAVRLNNKSLRG